MNKTTNLMLLSTVCVIFAGCKSGVPTQPSSAPQPAQSTTTPAQPHASAPKADNCDAISDPVLAEDCRFDKKVAADKKKHNSNNVVKHSPGSIQQP